MSSSQQKMWYSKSPGNLLTKLKLVLIHLRVTLFRMWEACKICFRYYRKPTFLLRDATLATQYVFCSPHHLHKRSLKERPEEEKDAYGQTPLSVLDRIARECRLLSKDVVFELGCGTGRTTFWLATFVRCKAVGIDLLAPFIEKAERTRRLMRVHNASFRKENFLTADYSGVTAIYLYGSAFGDEMIAKIIKTFAKLPKGTKVISVTYPLTAFSDDYVLEKSFPCRYPWGVTDVYLNIKR